MGLIDFLLDAIFDSAQKVVSDGERAARNKINASNLSSEKKAEMRSELKSNAGAKKDSINNIRDTIQDIRDSMDVSE